MPAPHQIGEPTWGARLLASLRFLALILTISGGLGIAWSAYEAGFVNAGPGVVAQRSATGPVVPLVLAGPTTFALPTVTAVASPTVLPTAAPRLAHASSMVQATAQPAVTAEPTASIPPTVQPSPTTQATATAQPTATARPSLTATVALPAATAQPTALSMATAALPTATAALPAATAAAEPSVTPAPQLAEIAPPQPVDAAVAAMAEVATDAPGATATPTPTRVRSGNYRGRVQLSFGASGEDAVTPSGAWGVVQWVDGQSNWHNIDGWTGAVGPEGTSLWVEPKDFGTGPFRWCLYDAPNGTLTGVSDPFYLPERASEPLQVVMNPAPAAS